MSAQFRSREEMADYAAKLVRLRAGTKKHARLLKLGKSGRYSVVMCALQRLLYPSPADPLKLLTKKQRERMQRRPKPIANIAFHSPAESPYWIALTKLYGCLFELSSFWNLKTDAERIKAIDLAIGAERKAFVRGAAFSVKRAKRELDGVDRNKVFDLSRHVDVPTAAADDAAQTVADAPDTFHLPETDSDIAENILNSYARRGEAQRALDAGGKPMFLEFDLVTGYYASLGDPRKRLPRKNNERWDSRFDQTAMRYFQQRGDESELAKLDAHIAQKKREAEISKAELAALKAERRLHVAREVLKIKNSKLADLKMFAELLCEGAGSTLDELVAGSIVPKNPST